MLRRSFLKGVGALFAAAAVPAFALKESSIAITYPDIQCNGKVAIQFRCKDEKFRWFIIPASKPNYFIEYHTKLKLPSEQLKFYAHTIVDLEEMKYYKRRDDNTDETITLVDRLAISKAPDLDRDTMFPVLNSYTRLYIEDPRVRFERMQNELAGIVNPKAVQLGNRV